MQPILDRGLWLCLLVLPGAVGAAPSAREIPDASPSPTIGVTEGAPVLTNANSCVTSVSPAVVALEFADFFKNPAGPRGLEFTETLRALDGRRVQLRGFMIRQEDPPPRCFLFAPRPVKLHEHEYGFADELPPTTVHVFAAPGTSDRVPFTPGPLQLTGTLSLGARPEPDGRTSLVRLHLDPPTPEQRRSPEQAGGLAPVTAPHAHPAHGMGIAHRTAARLMLHGAQLGKANATLAMDTLPVTGLVITHSLNSIVTDSSPGAACYATGNKSNNNQQGVFPDDTADAFDNPRVELMSEYLWRKEGRTLGIVTTSDVFDATPGAFGTHTANRGAGTGICDQYLDEAAAKAGLRVLLGGGRKWFLPGGTPGSQRSTGNDYVLPAELAGGWAVAAGALDAGRDLIADFQNAGFFYASDKTTLEATPAQEDRLFGLFSYSNMNVAKDKIDKRRNPGAPGRRG